jgi:transcriptional regulator with XRE-family HTH domain
MTVKPFDKLMDDRFSPEQQKKIEEAAQKKIRAIRLGELRERLGQKQEELAKKLGVTQSGVSRIEMRKNLRMKTLKRYLEAMGGRLEVRAVFEDSTEVLISTESE